MTRRSVLLSALPIAARPAPSTSAMDDRIVEFHRHWNQFLRVYLGCPKRANDIGECDVKRGAFDYPEFIKAAKIGRKLFETV
jgi:hypothetical protein